MVSGEPFSARRNAFAVDGKIGNSYYFTAEATMLVAAAAGEWRIEPETAGAADIEVLDALDNRPVRAIDVVEDGSLVVHFVTGERITLLSSTNAYEAWTFHRPDGLFIGMPGGGLG